MKIKADKIVLTKNYRQGDQLLCRTFSIVGEQEVQEFLGRIKSGRILRNFALAANVTRYEVEV